MKNALAFLVVILGLFSCSDEDIFLEDPDSIVIENYFRTPDEFERALRGAYNGFKSTGYYGGSGSSGDFIILGDLLTDNLVTNIDGRGSNRQGHNWLYDASSVPTNLYNRAYRIVSRANLILREIDNLQDGDFKNQVRAEALALRAAAHFDLARTYSKMPTQSTDANSSIGIAYVTEFDPLQEPARLATVAEAYQLINDDLNEALALMPSGFEEVGRFSLNAIRGIATRVALAEGDYDRVITLGEPVIASVQPANADELSDLWTSASSPGVLFELPFIVGDELLDSNFSQGTGSGLIAEYSVDKAFYDLYDQATEPERTDAYFDIVNNWIVVNKYINGSQQQGLNNGRYLRVEEVLLNVAEAYALKASPDEAMALARLDALRSRRYSSFTGGETGMDLLEAIFTERRKELAFESSDRWYTLKRMQNVVNAPASVRNGVMRSGSGHLSDGTGVVPAELNLPAGSFKWQLPIARVTLNENPNMVQNDGY